MRYLAKTVRVSIDAVYEINTESPDSYNYYTGSIYLKNWEYLVLQFDLSDAVGRKINNAELRFVGRSEDEVYLELYSGYEHPMTYKKLKNNCVQHAWSGSNKQISVDVKKNAWNTVSLSGYSAGLSAAINSGNKLIIVIKPEATAQIEVSDSFNAILELECENLNPVAYDLSPNKDKQYVNRAFALGWYIEADEAHQTSYELGWSADNGTTWNTITKESVSYNYESAFFGSYAFPEGTIKWRVRITTNEGKVSEYAYATFECVKQIPIVNVINPNGIGIPNDRSYRFEWEYSGEDLAQAEYEIGWSSDDGLTWNTVEVESANNYHVFAAGEFPVGNIKWRIRTSNGYYFSEYADAEFVYVATTPKVSVEFPDQIKIPSSVRQIFTWIYSGNDLPQISYEIGWSSDDGINWNDVSGVGDVAHHIFDAETFPVGNIKWRIRTENSEGYFSEYAYGTFECVGKGNVPVIESITQSAIPSITWSAEHQAAYEVQIKKDDAVIYSSGMIGGENKEHTANVMLDNGEYIVQLRIMNSYGYISEWGTMLHLLEAETPNSSASFKITENKSHGAEFKCWDLIGNGYIVRVEDDIETIVAKCSEEELYDYHTKCDKTYTYILRDCVNGFKNARYLNFKTDFIGVLLHDNSNMKSFVNIKWNESERVNENETMSKNTVYCSCIGREYPIKETNEQKTEMITVEGFLNPLERDLLRKFYEGDKLVLLRSKNYCFVADISSYKETVYMDEGYLVQVTLTRVDEISEVNVV